MGRVSVDRLGLPLFTLAIGLVDGFNPCATWVLLFLLAMLVNLKSRSRMALIAGTFVLVSGLVYFAFMAAWLTFFMVLGVSQPLRLGLAAVALVVGSVNLKDALASGGAPSLGIPESARPGLYRRVRGVLHAENLAGALAGIVALAFLVNLVELLCTAGLPALYTAILTARGLTGPATLVRGTSVTRSELAAFQRDLFVVRSAAMTVAEQVADAVQAIDSTDQAPPWLARIVSDCHRTIGRLDTVVSNIDRRLH